MTSQLWKLSRWLKWYEHHAHIYEPPTAPLYVGKYVGYLPKVGGFLRAHRFPLPVKRTDTICSVFSSLLLRFLAHQNWKRRNLMSDWGPEGRTNVKNNQSKLEMKTQLKTSRIITSIYPM